MNICHLDNSDSIESGISSDSAAYKTTLKFSKSEIGNDAYLSEVRRIIYNEMDCRGINGCHWHSFNATFRKRRGLSYVKPDPWFDAWLTVQGKIF